MKKILIGVPVHNRAWILPLYLKHIKNIEYDKSLISLYFIVNNTNDNSLNILKEFKKEHEKEYRNIFLEVQNSKIVFEDARKDALRKKYTYEWLSRLRNKILKKTVDLNCDYLFSCDTDILVNPNIISDLLNYNKDCVASLIYNGYELYFKEFYKFPNILKKQGIDYKHIVNYWTSNHSKCPKEKLMEVDYTGAVFLASKEVCRDSGYAYGSQGEDEKWSESVIKAGYKLYCVPSVYSQHIMGQKFLDMYLEGSLPSEKSN